ncbi:MAG: tyrosinase family protein [Verrucomicrobiales bacterium]
MSSTTFEAFQTTLEGGPHNSGHRAVGGTMASASSPADPIFWMHHANIDRLWAIWQAQHPTKKPGNPTTNLLPTTSGGIISGKVRDTLDLSPAE